MSRFISNKLKKIDLGDGEWVEVLGALSFQEISKITTMKDDIEMSIQMLISCIKGWNIKDDEGNIPELNEKNIMLLDIPTITLILEKISKIINPESKKKAEKK